MKNGALDSSNTITNISAEEKLNRLNTDIGQLKKFGDLADRVFTLIYFLE